MAAGFGGMVVAFSGDTWGIDAHFRIAFSFSIMVHNATPCVTLPLEITDNENAMLAHLATLPWKVEAVTPGGQADLAGVKKGRRTLCRITRLGTWHPSPLAYPPWRA